MVRAALFLLFAVGPLVCIYLLVPAIKRQSHLADHFYERDGHMNYVYYLRVRGLVALFCGAVLILLADIVAVLTLLLKK
jgi:cytosine/uracil/thiamine/allantoin permease